MHAPDLSKIDTPERIPAMSQADSSVAGGQEPRRKLSPRGGWMLLILLAGLSAMSTVGCAAEGKKPLTVNEFLALPRVGESSR